MSICKACQVQEKTWNGDDPTCAFLSGIYNASEGWRCGTMNKLHHLTYKLSTMNNRPEGTDVVFKEDTWVYIFNVANNHALDDIYWGITHIFIRQYKSRARYERIELFGLEDDYVLNEAGMLVIIEELEKMLEGKNERSK